MASAAAGYEAAAASPSTRRAWIEIAFAFVCTSCAFWSPSTRRAWIEMPRGMPPKLSGRVALHPEGVDRNPVLTVCWMRPPQSPSTRRAWIEIPAAENPAHQSPVALHPEGVDRNRYL